MKRIDKVQKKYKEKAKSQDMIAIEKENRDFTVELVNELDTNLEYSLTVDPLNKYNLSDSQKKFIEMYVQFKSIPMCAELCGIDIETAKQYFVSYASQQEIRRINRALYKRQFSKKLLSIDEIGGWLSSLLTDEDIPLADRVSSTQKIRVAQMLIDLNTYKHEAILNPESVMTTDIENEVKSLSIKSIKSLLYNQEKSSNEDKKLQLMNEVKKETTLLPEEEAFLKSLSVKELLQLLNDSSTNETEGDNKCIAKEQNSDK